MLTIREARRARGPAVRGLLAAGMLGAVALSAPAGATTLVESIRAALETHPQIEEARAEARAAERDTRAALGAYFPTLDAEGNVGHEESDIKQLHLAGLDNRHMGKREFSLTARQMLFDGFGTPAAVERRRALEAAAGGTLDDVRESVSFGAVRAHIEVLRNRRLVQLAEDNVASHEGVLAKVEEKVEGGLSGDADLHQANARVALARSTLTAREGGLREAVTRYRRVVGELPGDLVEPPAPPRLVVTDGSLDRTRLSRAVADAVREANEHHPALSAAESEVTAARQDIRVARAGYYPHFDLEGSITRNSDVSGVEGVRNTNALLLVGRWNLFRGGADKAREEARAARHAASRSAEADVRRSIEEQVALAVQAKATSELRLGHLAAHVAASERTVTSYEAQLRLGRRTLLDTLNAESELFSARSNHTSGLYNDVLNHYLVEASKGRLTASLKIDR